MDHIPQKINHKRISNTRVHFQQLQTLQKVVRKWETTPEIYHPDRTPEGHTEKTYEHHKHTILDALKDIEHIGHQDRPFPIQSPHKPAISAVVSQEGNRIHIQDYDFHALKHIMEALFFIQEYNRLPSTDTFVQDIKDEINNQLSNIIIRDENPQNTLLITPSQRQQAIRQEMQNQGLVPGPHGSFSWMRYPHRFPYAENPFKTTDPRGKSIEAMHQMKRSPPDFEFPR
jgi:hypothetical protein